MSVFDVLTLIAETIDPEVFMALIDGTFYEFVDTPGFGDTRRTDEEVLRRISQYLATSGDLFHGIIYLHSIAHNRVSGSMMAQIRAFKAICGSSFFSRLVIGTTFWEATRDVSAALAREQQLFSEDGYFEDVIDLGAQTTRVFRTEEACLEAIKLIPHDEPLSLQIQSELEGDAEFNHTSAAAAVSPEQYRRQQEHEERMRQEQETAERERLENERRAEEEEAGRAQAYAEVERLRLLEVDCRQREYELEQARRRAEQAQRWYLRDMERLAAEQARREAVRVAEMKAEIERVAEEQKRAEAERQRRESEQREADLRVLRAEEEEKQKRLRRIEHCKRSFRNWHISWVSTFVASSPQG
jgi:chemotaxis protein histidine kinase CheA